MSKYWNETVKKIEPYVPGEQPQDKKYIKLNTNENPYPPSPKAIYAMSKALNEKLKLYPDPLCRDLIKEISLAYNLSENEVFVGNGSDEVLGMAFLAFFSKEKKVSFPDISYSFYEVYGNFFNVTYDEIPLDENFDIPLHKFEKTKGGCILPNPNAPTSKYIKVEKLKELLVAKKDEVIIIDEAYIDFGGQSMAQFIKEYDNLLVIQTFSKSRSLAGIRVGFAMGSKELIEGLNRVKNSFNSYTLDSVAIAGATASIMDKEYFEETRKRIINTREKTIEEFNKLGFTSFKSKANFIFTRHKELKGEFLYKTLKDNGILVRYFNKPRINNYLRITIGTEEEMDILINVLKKII